MSRERARFLSARWDMAGTVQGGGQPERPKLAYAGSLAINAPSFAIAFELWNWVPES